jgi:hypothetical protein
LEALERVIESDGMSWVSKGGVARLHPSVAEARQTASALSGVQMADTVKDPVKQAAAQERWRDHNLAKAQRS